MSNHSPKLDHMGLPVTSLDKSKVFYTAALAPLGMSLLGESDSHAAFGIGHTPYLIVRLAKRVEGSTHVAFLADSRVQVDAFHLAGINAGGTDGGAPGLRPDYHEHYYAAFVRDPDGHNIELVKHTLE